MAGYYSLNSPFYTEGDFQENPDYTPSAGIAQQPTPPVDMAGGGFLANPQPTGMGLSGLKNYDPAVFNQAATDHIDTSIPGTGQPQEGGLHDYWKQPSVGNMPLHRFVQLAGMMGHALDPKGFGGILGAGLANMAGQGERDMLGYEERTAERDEARAWRSEDKAEERAWRTQQYEELRKQKRDSEMIDFAVKSNNPLVKQKIGQSLATRWNQDNPDNPMPEGIDWNRDESQKFLQGFQEIDTMSAKLGWTPEETKEMKKGYVEKQYLGAVQKPEKPANIAHNVIEVPSKDGKMAQKYQYNVETNKYDIPIGTPYLVKSQVPNVNVHTGGGENKSVDKAVRRLDYKIKNDYDAKIDDFRVQLTNKKLKPKDREVLRQNMARFEAERAKAVEVRDQVLNGELAPSEITWGGSKPTTKQPNKVTPKNLKSDLVKNGYTSQQADDYIRRAKASGKL